jgi:hypothetical protein
MNRWGSTFLTSEAEFDKTYWGAIDAGLAASAVVEDNYVAGAERTGIHVRGMVCDGAKLPGNLTLSIKNNTVYGAGNGVAVSREFHYASLPCLKISGFTVYRSQYYGIYYQGKFKWVYAVQHIKKYEITYYNKTKF